MANSDLMVPLTPYVQPDNNKKLIKRGRVKTPADAVAIFQQDWNADLESKRQRARWQEVIDCMPPYSTNRDANLGYAGRTNVNWGLGAQALAEATTPYNNILDVISDEFCTLPTDYGDEASRMYWEPVMAEEFTSALLEWPEFHPLWQENCRLFVSEGLSLCFFEDDISWEWRVVGQQYLQFPRRVRANIEKLDHVSCRVLMLPHELYQHVKNQKAASDEGWNIPEVMNALRNNIRVPGIAPNDAQAWEAYWKDNDITMGCTNATISTIHLWVKELDGSTSRYICNEDGSGDWLYKAEGRYHAMSRHIISYQYGVGSNGDFQSIRGLGHQLFSPVCAINRVLCKYVDMANHVATPHLQAENEDAINDIPIKPLGPYMSIGQGYQFVETKVPDFGQNLLPLLNVLQGYYASQAGRWTQGVSNTLDRTERTKYEKQMQYEQQGSMSTSNMTLFFSAWERHLKEIVRRIINRKYTSSDPGGWLVHRFRARCMRRGVPAEAIFNIDVERIKANTGLGKGSATERAVIMDRMQVLYPRLDPYGQRKLDQMMAASLVGVRKSRVLFPDDPSMRQPIDAQIAELENNQLVMSLPVEVMPEQNHDVHLAVHTRRLGVLNTEVVEGRMTLADGVNAMQPIWEHSNVHLELLDPTSPNLPLYKEALEQLGQVIINERKHQNAIAAREEQQMIEDGQEAQSGAMASGQQLMQATQAQMRLGEIRMKLDEREALHQQKLRHNEERERQQQQIRDAKTALELART